MYTDLIANALGPWAGNIGIRSLLLRVVLSAAISSIIGCERATKRHAAGVRTFVTISLASTFAMLMDCYMSSRISNYIYVLSAASILSVATISVNSVLFSSRSQIKGLTTSAARFNSRCRIICAYSCWVYLTYDKPFLDASL